MQNVMIDACRLWMCNIQFANVTFQIYTCNVIYLHALYDVACPWDTLLT